MKHWTLSNKNGEQKLGTLGSSSNPPLIFMVKQTDRPTKQLQCVIQGLFKHIYFCSSINRSKIISWFVKIDCLKTRDKNWTINEFWRIYPWVEQYWQHQQWHQFWYKFQKDLYNLKGKTLHKKPVAFSAIRLMVYCDLNNNTLIFFFKHIIIIIIIIYFKFLKRKDTFIIEN